MSGKSHLPPGCIEVQHIQQEGRSSNNASNHDEKCVRQDVMPQLQKRVPLDGKSRIQQDRGQEDEEKQLRGVDAQPQGKRIRQSAQVERKD